MKKWVKKQAEVISWLDERYIAHIYWSIFTVCAGLNPLKSSHQEWIFCDRILLGETLMTTGTVKESLD